MLEIDIFVQIQSFRLCLRITHIVFQMKLLLCAAHTVFKSLSTKLSQASLDQVKCLKP